MAGIPGPRDTDAEDVALKLEVAQTQWARGDHAEALKWLRKAADAAFDADDDKRGIELSKLAAELTAQDKVAPKPKLPPPRDPVVPPRVVPAKPVAPATPQIRSAPAAPAPKPTPRAAESPASRRGGDPKLGTTGARRAAAARAAEARAAQSPRSLGAVKAEPEPAPPVSKRGRSSRKSSPDLEDESTREYIVADVVKSRAVDLTKTRSDVHAASGGADEEWPTEAVDDIEELDSPPEHTQPRAVSKKAESRRRAADTPEHTETTAPGISVPYTQALRIAVGQAPDGRVVVRLLDANGLRAGERDALLVALTSEGITTLFS